MYCIKVSGMSPNNPQPPTSNAGMIGGVVGGAVGVILIIAIVAVFIVSRRRQRLGNFMCLWYID